MSHASKHYSVIQRKLNINDFSSKFVLSIAFAAFLVYVLLSLLNWSALDTSLAIGLNAAMAALLAWMIGREAEPDSMLVANLAAVVTTVLFYFTLPAGHLLVLELLIIGLCMRMISRPTGYKFTSFDLTII